MLKKSIIISLLVTLILTPSLLKSQSSDTSAVQFFVNLETLIPLDTIEDYLTDLNSTQLWYHNYSNLALWQVDSFPFTTADGEEIFDISGVIKKSVRKTKIKDADYNVLSVLEDMAADSTNSCFTPLDFSLEQGSNEVIISILDTGINPNMSNSSTSDLNYDLINYTGYDYVNDDTIPDDDHGHGSHVAGIIHSITHGIDGSGTAIKFDIRKTHNHLGQGFMSGIVKGLLDAVDEGASVINMSFGMVDTFDLQSFYPLRQAIHFAQEQNVIVLAAAGNEETNIDNMNNTVLPAAFPEANIITVSALNCNDSLSTFSNYGNFNSDLAVLGERIPGPGLGQGIEYKSGTSQATAILSAVAALLYSQHDNVSIEKLKCTLLNGVDELGDMDTMVYSGGKLNSTNSEDLIAESFTDYTVSNSLNSGLGSLRYAFEENCSVEKIYFDPVLNNDTISLINAPIYVDRQIRLIGNDLNLNVISALNSAAFVVNPYVELRLEQLSILSEVGFPSVKVKGTLKISSDVKLD